MKGKEQWLAEFLTMTKLFEEYRKCEKVTLRDPINVAKPKIKAKRAPQTKATDQNDKKIKKSTTGKVVCTTTRKTVSTITGKVVTLVVVKKQPRLKSITPVTREKTKIARMI